MDFGRGCNTQYILNSLPAKQREFLMKKNIREEICKFAGVDISIRGRYTKPREDGTIVQGSDRPLHLYISGPSKTSLDLATKKIQLLLKTNQNGTEVVDLAGFGLVEKITVGIDIFPSIFRMKSKLLGENGENIKYIEKETGAVISLQGKGSGYRERPCDRESTERLHILVKYKTLETQEKARELVLNLIETVQQDFAETYGQMFSHPKKPEVIVVRPSRVKTPPPPPPPKQDKIVVDNLTSTIEKIVIGLDRVPTTFNLKSKIYGPNLTNVKHIEKATGALLLVEGKGCNSDKDDESLEPPYILVKYVKPELKDSAKKLILNLIDTIHQEFITLYGTHPVKPRVPEIIPLKNSSSTSNISASSLASKFSKSAGSSDHEKSPKLIASPTMSKFPRKDSPVKSILSKRSRISPEMPPVPPPPPVISRTVSPDFIRISSVVSHRSSTPPLKSATPSPKSPTSPSKFRTSSRKSTSPSPIPLISRQTKAISKLAISAESLNLNQQRLRLSRFDQGNPIPSIVPPVTQMIPQQSSHPLYKPDNTPELIPLHSVSSLTNQTSDSQYFNERSNSPIEYIPEIKRFCDQLMAEQKGKIASISGNGVQRDQLMAEQKSQIGSISCVAAQREPLVAKTKMTPNRYLVPLQEVDIMSIPVVVGTQTSTSANIPVILSQNTTTTEVTRTSSTPASAAPSGTVKRTPSPAKGMPAPGRQYPGPMKPILPTKPTLTLKKRPAPEEPAKMLAANGQEQSGSQRKRVRFPNDDEHEREKPKNHNTPSIRDTYCTANSVDEREVILIDSDEEAAAADVMKTPSSYPERRKPRPGKRSVSVQTDENELYALLSRTDQCLCGRFRKIVTGIRSWGTQTSSNTPKRH